MVSVAALTLAFLGDLMLGRTVSELVPARSPEWIWGDALPVLRGADAVLANLECPITAHREPWRASWKAFHFRADPAAASMLGCANLRFLSLANNHILDFGPTGLFDTVAQLDRAGIRHAGAGRNAAEASAPAILDLPSLRVGVIAATDTMRPFRAGPDSPGTNYIEIGEPSAALDRMQGSIKALRREGAHLIVLSLHWGPNMRLHPRRRFQRFARAAIEGGVDVIHGHSAHVFHAVERYRGGVILYDTGNFIDDHWNFWNFGSYWNFPFRHDDWSFIFLIDVAEGSPRRLRLLPVRTRPWPLTLASGKTFEKIRRRARLLSARLGTPIRETAEGLELAIAP